VDLALSRDPATRATWYDARAAAAAAGSRRSLFLPSLDVGGTLTAQHPAKSPGRSTEDTVTAGAAASITWILLDLGGRAALVNEADRLLAAARLAEHAAVADLVLRVQQTYYLYLAARALVESEGAAVKQAETSLAAAEGRRRAGVATVAEVLQARTALSQVRLTLQQFEGQALALRGALATLAGLPPTAPLDDVGTLPAQVDVAAAQPAVEDLLAAAETMSPDLARSRAIADAADARARAASRVWAPVLGVQGNAGWSHFLEPSELGDSSTWTGTVFLRIPTFQGLAPAYDALAARATADAARARAGAVEQGVALDVWTAFQGVRTAARSVETSRDLLASARASAEVATGRYREGVGSILDLLTAQAALESARAQDVRARADFLVSLAQLSRATGRLELPPPTPPPPAATIEGPATP
jgi:outer membrane protein TolC